MGNKDMLLVQGKRDEETIHVGRQPVGVVKVQAVKEGFWSG